MVITFAKSSNDLSVNFLHLKNHHKKSLASTNPRYARCKYCNFSDSWESIDANSAIDLSVTSVLEGKRSIKA